MCTVIKGSQFPVGYSPSKTEVTDLEVIATRMGQQQITELKQTKKENEKNIVKVEMHFFGK